MDFDSMTEKEAFKAGFMAYCKSANWADDQIEQRVKSARTFFDDYKYYLNQTWNPSTWGELKGDTFDKVMTGAGRAAAGVGTAAGATAAAVAGGVPAGLAAAGRGVLGAGRAGVSALGRLLGLGRTVTPPVPPAGAAAAPGMLGTLLRWGPVAAIAGGASRVGGGAATAAGSNLGNLGLLALGAPIAGGLALGGGLGWGAAKLTDPKLTDDDLKADELEQAYRIQAKRLKARRDYEQYRSARSLDS